MAIGPGGIYLTGTTAYGMYVDDSDAMPFPTTPLAYDTSRNGEVDNGGSNGWDGFVVRVVPLVDSVGELTQSVLDVAADATSVAFDVVREGDPGGNFQVDYEAVADLAEGSMVVASGTLEWADGASQAQTVEIPLPPAGTSGSMKAASTSPPPNRIILSQPNGRLASQHEASIVRATSPDPDPVPGSSAAGGGGALDLSLMLMMGLIALGRRLRRDT